MYRRAFRFLPLFFPILSGWSQPYTISTVAGTDRLRDGSSATSAPLRAPTGVAFDVSGNLYIADTFDNRIRKVDTSGIISTFAGTGLPGYNGDRLKATAAKLNGPASPTFDANGNLYFVDVFNSRVRVISPDGTINTVAGNGSPGFLGDNGPALQAQLNPLAVAADNKGALYISTNDFRIRKVDTAGTITTIAGTGNQAYAGDNGPAISASISHVDSLATDSKGNLYLADYDNGYVRMIDTTGAIHPIAGSGQFGFPFDYIPAQQAVMLPYSITLDASGNNLFIADADLIHTVVDQVDLTTGLIHAIAGNGNFGFLGDNGPPLNAELNFPQGVALDSSNAVYVADFGNARVRRITPSRITTVAGTGSGDGGPATSAFLNFPIGLAVDSASNVVVADFGSTAARRFSPGGSINTFGQLLGAPVGVTVDSTGNFYVTDTEPLVLKITPAGVTSIVAGDGQSGYRGDNQRATAAMINEPSGIAVDAANNVYITDFADNRIRKVDSSSGLITTVAGNGNFTSSGDGGAALNAGFTPRDIAIDSQANLYIADEFNNRIRKITPAGIISTVVGRGAIGYAGDGGPASLALLNSPTSVAVDSAGNLYIADRGNNVIRRVTNGLITTIAGTGAAVPASGDGGPAIAAQLDPFYVKLDGAGDIFVSDSLNDRVRKLTPLVIAPAAMSMVSGDQQSGTVGTQLNLPLVVKVAAAGGAGVSGVMVSFTVNPAGAATVSPSPAITLNDGTVSANVTLGSTAGNLTITASANGVHDLSFSLTATPAVSPTVPVISAAGIVGGGLSSPPLTTAAPNAIVTIFGDKFAPAGTARQVGQGDLVNGKIPVNLAGVCAVFGTELAPILGVYPGQLNVQVPKLPPGQTMVQVITQCGTPQAQTSNAEPVTVEATAPEFFYFLHNSGGHNPIAAINAVTHGYVGAPGLVAGSTFTPAKLGDLLTLFATGFGATNPSFGPGELPGAAAQVTSAVSIKFGGLTLAASDVLYVGVTENAGLYQVNLRVPDKAPDGDQTVLITIGGVPSPSGGFITVKSATSSTAPSR